MASPPPDEPEWTATFHAATAAFTSLDYPTAADEYRRAVELAERLHSGDEPLAESLEGLAMALSYLDGSADVSHLLNRTSELRLKLLAEIESSLGPEHLDVAECVDSLAGNRLWQNNPSEAIAFYQRALEIRINALGEDHYDVAATLHHMADVYSVHEHNREAAARHWQRAVAILDRLQANLETRAGCVSNLLRVVLERLGLNAFEQKDDAAAEAWFRRVAEVTGHELGSAGIAPIYAKVLIRRQKFEDSEIVLDAALKIEMRATAWKDACQEALIDLCNATGSQDEVM